MAKPDSKASMTRAEYRESVRKDAKGNFLCEHCGVAAYRSVSGTNRSRGSGNRFCCMECRRGWSIARQQAERLERERIGLLRALARTISKVAKSRVLKPAPLCVVCGGPTPLTKGRNKKYCTMECKRSTEVFKEGRRTYKHLRRARTRGAHAETFAPVVVLERDGWRCQICGVSTPKSRRGTTHANAPELDHIQPLSKGGAHTMANTQCACRACNQRKSDGAAMGQIGLFSSLVASCTSP